MPMFKKQLAALLFVAAAAICTVLYTSHTDSSAELQPASDNISPAQGAASASDKIVVYVTGAVNNPGVIELPADSRIIDAVNKCGGMNESADPENINMAQKVTDGSQIKIPDKSNSDTAAGNAPAAADKSGRININTADETELDKLPGVGPAMAKRIVEYRQNNGRFQSAEDLKKVRGIGDSKYTALKDKITI